MNRDEAIELNRMPYGQGHIKTLRDLVVQHPDSCLVDPLPFLR